MVLVVEGTTEKLRQEISSIKEKAKKDYRENKWVSKKKISNSNSERKSTWPRRVRGFLKIKFV